MVICKNKINFLRIRQKNSSKYKAVLGLELDAQARNESITETQYAVFPFFTGTLFIVRFITKEQRIIEPYYNAGLLSGINCDPL